MSPAISPPNADASQSAGATIAIGYSDPADARRAMARDTPGGTRWHWAVTALAGEESGPALANNIHPTAVIGAGVEIGEDNVIGPYTVIVGPCRIGDGNFIGPHVSIGGPAEYLGAPHPAGWDGEIAGAGVVIGNGSRIREFVTVNQGVVEPTRVGDDCYVMGRAHLGHDVAIHDGVVLASVVQLAGHVTVGSWSNLGLGTMVHQRTRIGPGAMVGMGTIVRKDIAPFTITLGNPARTTGINHVGLTRRGCDAETVERLTEYLTGRSQELPPDLPAPIRDQLFSWAKDAATPIGEH